MFISLAARAHALPTRPHRNQHAASSRPPQPGLTGSAGLLINDRRPRPFTGPSSPRRPLQDLSFLCSRQPLVCPPPSALQPRPDMRHRLRTVRKLLPAPSLFLVPAHHALAKSGRADAPGHAALLSEDCALPADRRGNRGTSAPAAWPRAQACCTSGPAEGFCKHRGVCQKTALGSYTWACACCCGTATPRAPRCTRTWLPCLRARARPSSART